jgi:hypothetical protein
MAFSRALRLLSIGGLSRLPTSIASERWQGRFAVLIQESYSTSISPRGGKKLIAR